MEPVPGLVLRVLRLVEILLRPRYVTLSRRERHLRGLGGMDGRHSCSVGRVPRALDGFNGCGSRRLDLLSSLLSGGSGLQRQSCDLRCGTGSGRIAFRRPPIGEKLSSPLGFVLCHEWALDVARETRAGKDYIGERDHSTHA